METISDRWKRAVAHMADGPWGKRGGGSDSSGSGSGGGSGGGDGPRNPWNLPPGGGRGPRKPVGPAALDQLFDQVKGRFGGGGGGSSGGGGDFGGVSQFRIFRNILLGVILLWIVFTSFHQIGAQEEGVIMRLGKYAGNLSPGIGLTLPAPIDQVTKVPVQVIDTIDIPEGTAENLILTRDENIIDLAYSVRWDVKDPQNFLFQLADTRRTIREVSESAMREVVSSVTLNEAMGPSRDTVGQRVAQRAQDILDDYGAGVRIRGVAIKQADPPEAVNDAFKEVTVAQQNRQANINNANAYAQQIISRAQGEAAAFDKVFEQYKFAPEVTRRRMYYETMEDVLSRMDKTIVEPNSVAPYLPIGRNPKPQVTVEEGTR